MVSRQKSNQNKTRVVGRGQAAKKRVVKSRQGLWAGSKVVRFRQGSLAGSRLKSYQIQARAVDR